MEVCDRTCERGGKKKCRSVIGCVRWDSLRGSLRGSVGRKEERYRTMKGLMNREGTGK